MESRHGTDPRKNVKLKKTTVVNRQKCTDHATTHRPLPGFVTILLFLTYGTIALAERYNLKEESELFNKLKEEFNIDVESYKRDISKCAEQTEATKDDITKFLRNKPQDTDQGKCFLACIMKNIGIMKNNEIDKERYMNLNRMVHGEDVEILEHLKIAIGKCSKLSKGLDECEHTSFFTDCMFLSTNHILKRGHREKQKEEREPTKRVLKERAKKGIKDEL